jgi:hypothetical protein
VGRIRAAYPWLRIVGNAGGKLWSNQLKYADLVDVLVGHESSFATLQAKSSLLDPRSFTASSRTAALLHATSAENMVTAVERVFAAHYSHVYTTDQTASAGNNVWGRLSNYLEAQVAYLTYR